LKNLLSVLFLAAFCITCKQEKKSENLSEADEIPELVSLSASRYVIGDSVRIGFSEPVSNVNVHLDGKLLLENRASADTLPVSSLGQKTGWHQLIVNGLKKDKSTFSDTLSVELISDVIPEEMSFTIIGQYPHLKTSFTEGLEFYKGELYESTGENGKSLLIKTDLKTGAAIKSVALEEQYFGEGITIVNDHIHQLTWKSGTCFMYNMDFKLEKTFTYYFQGWGLTHKDSTLMMSDGSNKIHFYNTEFEKTGEIQVYDNTGLVRNLNELEYVDGFIYANIFETTKIVKIDPATGKVVGFLNMSGIVPAETDVRKDVLNGIAYHDGAFYVTGKNWPLLFKIRLKNQTKSKKSPVS
jgi:glutamine cyclotransferase